MDDVLVILGLAAVWFVVHHRVLPRLRVPT
jgi:hypothetical protein